MTYDALPQSDDIMPDGTIRLMSMEDVVVGALRGDPNCLEWFRRDISSLSPAIIPDGYRYDPQHKVFIPPNYAYCVGCKRVHPLSAFGVDERNTGRGKTRSRCRKWEAQDQGIRDRHRKVKKLTRKWKRG